MPTLNIGHMSLAELREFGELLMREHYEEVALNKQVMTLAPDWDRYEEIADRGVLRGLGLWVNYGTHVELGGYSLNFAGPHLHYRDLFVLQNDVFFVRKPFRRATLTSGVRASKALIDATKDLARECGARLLLWHAKEGTAFETLMRRRARVQDIIFSEEV
jgi:hypothetical protein